MNIINQVLSEVKPEVRQYELSLVVRPDLELEGREKLLDLVRKMVTNWGGQIDKTEEAGRKILAYQIKKYNEAWYYFLDISLPANRVSDLDTKLRLNEDVIRHLIVAKQD